VIKEISLSNCTEQVYLATCQNEALTVHHVCIVMWWKHLWICRYYITTM